MAAMTEVLVQPEGSPGPGGEQRPERGVEEPEGKRAPNTGARLWGRVRSKLLRQKVLGVRGDSAGLWGGSAVCGDRVFLVGGCVVCAGRECCGVRARSGDAVWVLGELLDAVGSLRGVCFPPSLSPWVCWQAAGG